MAGPGITRFDAIIVGTGATGGWCAKELSEAGLRVLCIDAGPHLDLAVATGDRRPAPTREQRIQRSHRSWTPENAHLFVDDADNPYSVPEGKPFQWIRSRQVGGRTLLWGRICLRISDYEFEAARRDGSGGCWPIGYEDLKPFYDRVETFLGVRGSREGLAHAPDPVVHNPTPMSPGEATFKDLVERRWSTRKVIHSRGLLLDDVRRPTWPLHTSQGSTLAAAERTGNYTLKAGHIALEILGKDGVARGLRVLDIESDRVVEYEAPIVILAGSTLETIRLLLLSKSPRHPNGIGNANDLVGRGLMDHPAARIFGRAPRLGGVGELPAGGPNGIYLPRFRNISEPSSRFVRGYHIIGAIQRHGLSEVVPGYMRQSLTGRSNEPAPDDDCARFILGAPVECLPHPANRAVLDPSTRDRWGIPILRIEMAYGENEYALLDDAQSTLSELAEELGFDVTKQESSTMPGASIHEVGGAAMGDDHASVVNADSQCWEMPNLFVVDGACWPSSPNQNPTLTMMALAVRCSHKIIERLKRGESLETVVRRRQ